MRNRDACMQQFLLNVGWENAQSSPITGDASTRLYQRLIHPVTHESTVLMDAPPSNAGSMAPFQSVARYLHNFGLSAPEILACDLDHGFLLLEDLGQHVFADTIARDPSSELALYEAALEVIYRLHDNPNPDIPHYDANRMADAVDLAFLYYREEPAANLDGPAKEATTLLAEKLGRLEPFNKVSLRDYHAENLIWLPDRTGVKRVGLLDFQDAVQTHPAYDLVSLIRDARREVLPEIADHLINKFCHDRDYNEQQFRAAFALISVQRNLRILGIFARLSRLAQKNHYVDLIPRVWGYLQTDLAHASLSDLAPALNAILPKPTPEFLNVLRTPCHAQQ